MLFYLMNVGLASCPSSPFHLTNLKTNTFNSRRPCSSLAMTRIILGSMKRRLFTFSLVLYFPMLGSCTCAAACDGPNVTLSTAGIPRPTTLMSPPSNAIDRSDILRVATSLSVHSDDGGHNNDGQGTVYHQTVPIDDQSSYTTPAVTYTGGQVLVTAPANIDQEIDPAFSRYYFAVELLEGAPDIDLLAIFALDAYRRQQYWQASVSAIAVLLKILKSVNIAVKFTMDTSQSNTQGLGTLLQPSHVQEACASLAVHAPTEPLTINMFTISTHSRVASDVTHGAVIVSPTGAGTAPHTGPYHINSTTPSYTVHAVYT
jgi:hypothetical protein